MNQTEIYKTIPNYSNYEVSNMGNIRNKKTGHILSKGSEKHRYEYVNIVNDNGKSISRSLHLFVAEAFIPKPESDKKLNVNHKDRNKKNNIATNLEWVTQSENVKHTVKTGRKISINVNKKCKLIFEDGTESQVFNSFADASKYYNMSRDIIAYVSRKNTGNFAETKYLNKKFKVEIIQDQYDQNIEWRTIDIDGFKHLEACKEGLIRNKKTKKNITGSNEGRYMRVKGDKSVKSKSLYFHHIIAKMFIPNPNNKPYVNHIDSNGFNNSVNNLEWATQSENMQHSVKYGNRDFENQKKVYRKVYQLELDGTVIQEFDGIVNAKKFLEDNNYTSGQSISVICALYKKGTYQTSSGFGWCYTEDYEGPIVSDSLKKMFPEIVDRNNINYYSIRKYIINISRPIWQIDLDGTRINKFDSLTDAAKSLNIGVTNINMCLKNSEYLANGYSFRLMTYDDIVNQESYKIKNIPDKIKNIFKIDDDTFIHPKIVNLLRNNISDDGSVNIKTPPVVQESLNNKFIAVYPSPVKARNYLDLKRETVEAVLSGKNKTSGGYKFRYLRLDDPVLDLI